MGNFSDAMTGSAGDLVNARTGWAGSANIVIAANGTEAMVKNGATSGAVHATFTAATNEYGIEVDVVAQTVAGNIYLWLHGTNDFSDAAYSYYKSAQQCWHASHGYSYLGVVVNGIAGRGKNVSMPQTAWGAGSTNTLKLHRRNHPDGNACLVTYQDGVIYAIGTDNGKSKYAIVTSVGKAGITISGTSGSNPDTTCFHFKNFKVYDKGDQTTIVILYPYNIVRTASAITATMPTPDGDGGSYTYQWYRSTAVGTKGSALTGQTALNLNDTTVSAGTTYYYTLDVTGATTTVSSLQFRMLAATATYASSAKQLDVGDSLTLSYAARSGHTYPELAKILVTAKPHVDYVQRGVSGTGAWDFVQDVIGLCDGDADQDPGYETNIVNFGWAINDFLVYVSLTAAASIACVKDWCQKRKAFATANSTTLKIAVTTPTAYNGATNNAAFAAWQANYRNAILADASYYDAVADMSVDDRVGTPQTRADCGAAVSTAKTITLSGSGWSSGTVTLKVTGHGWTTGHSSWMYVEGVTPSGYNGHYLVTVVDANNVSYSLANNPGSMTVAGQLWPYWLFDFIHLVGGYEQTATLWAAADDRILYSAFTAGTVSIASKTSTSLSLSTTAPSGGSGTGTLYQFQISLHGAATWSNVGSNSSSTTQTATGLTANTAYDIQCRYSDSILSAATGTLNNQSTDAVLVAGTVSNGTATATTIPVSTTASTGGSGSGRQYKFQVSLTGANSWSDVAAASSSLGPITATGLTASTGYDFRCINTDSDGNSVTSSTLTNVVTAAANLGSITLTAPNGGEGYAAGVTAVISGTTTNPTGTVKVEFAVNGGSKTTISASVNVTAGAFTCNWNTTGRTADARYQVWVTDNSDGTVVQHSAANFTVAAALVSPLHVNLAISADHASASWAAASGGFGTVHYQLQRAPDVSGSPGTWADKGASTTGLTQNDPDTLTEGSDYFYRVVCTDSGTVAATAHSVGTDNSQPIPAAPPTFTIDSVTPTPGVSLVVVLIWSDPAGVSVASITSFNLLVTGPNGYSQSMDVDGVDPGVDGSPIVATYTLGVTPPTDKGRYTVKVQAGTVADTAGNQVGAGVVASFQIGPRKVLRELLLLD